eukprot:TRINITY_DN32108_c0_g1_i1.p1 TRINITY_DN32108_c0_g1~~TRINITY_DN32108_c0_g1_i1.p1  ORF type:complete len:384 (+),score=85.41 TRINITY_DN32108_c0_g1_i1:60-1154(+)
MADMGYQSQSDDESDIEEETQQAQSVLGIAIGSLKDHPKTTLGSLLIVVTGVCVLMYFEEWQFVTCLYVVLQIITTIGYGDVVVTSQPLRVFMTVYVLFCLVIVANLINIVVNAIIERETQLLRDRIRKMEMSLAGGDVREIDIKKKHGPRNRLAAAVVVFLIAIASGTTFYALTEACSCSYGYTFENSYPNCVHKSFWNGTYMYSDYEACVVTGGSTLNWVDAMYMSVITATTIGFGDYTPKSVNGRYFGIFWMLFAVASAGFFITSLSTYIDGGYEQKEEKYEDAMAINQAIFDSIDVNHDREMSLAEYRCYMLMSHNIVPKDVMKGIDASFKKLDVYNRGRVKFGTVRGLAQSQLNANSME